MNEKAKGVIAWVFSWIGGLIILLSADKSEKKAKFHAAQSLTVGILYCALYVILTILSSMGITIPFVGTALSVVFTVCEIVGIVKAAQDQDPEIPVIGNMAQSIFGKKINEQ